ncbi:putative Corticotropin-releasing factor receptor 2 [Hypsibius exemplaris]|uniref:Corticotropin-releasing factor receptor 2 n=1 Tax=Hypsibius exemplaris TaxID=2072580 RepID=A0A1W0WUZ9_HYPEX|nr:putative Corticotropin-releasing factor receptor 2 [Hypsibius exemplaris]
MGGVVAGSDFIDCNDDLDCQLLRQQQVEAAEEDSLLLLPGTLSELDIVMDEVKCMAQWAGSTEMLRASSDEPFCEAGWNHASCWPPALPGELIHVACPADFGGLHYTYITNVTAWRQCYTNGTWDMFDNYTDCLRNQIQTSDPDAGSVQFAMTLNAVCAFLLYIGYFLSLGSCLLAISIYARFRTLCRLRNVIHLNLITTYVISGVAYLIASFVQQNSMSPTNSYDETTNQAQITQQNTTDIKGIIVAFTYGQMTTFFWALCEGIYMTCVLFRPHKLEQMLYWPFGVLGWVLPGVITAVWAGIKVEFDLRGDWLYPLNKYNYIYLVPILVVLALNLVLLIVALRTILQRQHSNARNGTSKVGRGVRSFLILLPLLGLTYVLVLITPSHQGVLKYIFDVIKAITLPTQGFFVSVMYTFCNRQVRGLLKFHCYRHLAQLRCHRKNNGAGGDDDGEDLAHPPMRECSSVGHSMSNNRLNMPFNAKNFNGNTNELQYILKTQKSNGKLRRQVPAESHTESLRISRTLSNKSQKKMPIFPV